MTCAGERHRVEVHDLKSWPEFFRDVVRGLKKVEIRLNDRDYHEGDLLLLREWEPPPSSERASPAWGGRYTGRMIVAEVKHILRGTGPLESALPEGWIAMSIGVVYNMNDGDGL